MILPAGQLNYKLENDKPRHIRLIDLHESDRFLDAKQVYEVLEVDIHSIKSRVGIVWKTHRGEKITHLHSETYIELLN